MMGSAQREVPPASELVMVAEEDFMLTEPRVPGAQGFAEPQAELKRQVTERLAAHRRRRGVAVEEVEAVEPTSQGRDVGHPRASGGGRRRHAAAAAVAERYAQTPSYRAFLAEQARQAAEEAAAKAEIARRNAEAAAAVQQELLVELALWDAPQEFTREAAVVMEPTSQRRDVGHPQAGNQIPLLDVSTPAMRDGGHPQAAGGLTVRLYEDLGVQVAVAARVGAGQAAPDAEEARALDAEIDFRKAPVFEDYKALLDRDGGPTIPLPANLLEFPRQLVAARRARPRLAEGPLRDEAPRSAQLRIFEVEAEQISTAPVVAAAAEWTTIRLDAHTETAPVAAGPGLGMPVLASLLPPQTAPLSLRMMAGLVDVGLVLAATVGFVAVFTKVAGVLPVGLPAVLALGGVALALYLLYQVLFFTLSEQTPGMRYARIGLCTFSDENPTRRAMRRRILAQVVAVGPAGLGLLWCLLDDDGLGWHDRISRMYQRAY